MILRTRALTLLMLTLAITAILLEIANKATQLTGGADGLSGVQVSPILGLFKFDLFGKTAFLYCLVALFVGWWWCAASSTRPSARCSPASARTARACTRSARRCTGAWC